MLLWALGIIVLLKNQNKAKKPINKTGFQKNHPRNIFVKQMFLIWISFQNFKCRKKIFWEILAVLFQTKKDYFYPFKNLKKVAPFHSSLKNCCKFLIFVKNWFPLFHEKNFKRSSNLSRALLPKIYQLKNKYKNYYCFIPANQKLIA